MPLLAIETIQDTNLHSLLLYATIGLESTYYINKNMRLLWHIIPLIFGICCLSSIVMALGNSALLRNIFHVNSRIYQHFLTY